MSGLASWKQFNELIADKNATPGMRTAYAQMFASKMLAEQERLGVPCQQAEDRARLVRRTDQGPDSRRRRHPDDPNTRQGVPQLIAAQKQLWGNFWPNIVPQIAPPVPHRWSRPSPPAPILSPCSACSRSPRAKARRQDPERAERGHCEKS